ncbi:MAG: flagellar basal-body rod protein FlgF [Rhodothermales bacterium]
MLLRLQNSVASMRAMMRQQERVANNLANVNTVGYKRDRTFTEALNEHLDEEGAPRSERRTDQWADHVQGALESTGNPLDVALDGEGFFVFSNEETEAVRYTRAGRLTLDNEGTLRDLSGWAIEGEGGPIQIPPTGGPIEISRNGEVSVDGQTVGSLKVVTFEDPLQLRRLDGAAFDAGALEPEPVENPVVLQKYYEASNVDPIREMTDMITFYRQFESHQKMMHTTDQILSAVTRSLGRF